MQPKLERNALDRFLRREIEWRTERKLLLTRLHVARVRRDSLEELWRDLSARSLEDFAELFRHLSHSSTMELLRQRKILVKSSGNAYELTYYSREGIEEALPMLVFQMLISDHFWRR